MGNLVGSLIGWAIGEAIKQTYRDIIKQQIARIEATRIEAKGVKYDYVA